MTGIRAARRVRDLPPSFFATLDAAIAEARARGVDVIDASKGNPDRPTPAAIVQAMQDAVADAENHRYPPHSARPALAAAIADRYRIDHGVRVDPARQVAVFHGSHEALMAAVLGLVEPGETLVVPDPGYPAYLSAAAFAGAQVRTLPLRRETDHQPDFADLGDLDRAAMLMLNYPHNPTGATAQAQTFERAAAECRRLDAVLVNDFAYSSLGFSARPVSALSVDTERTLEISTLSKTYSMAGWRIGYAVGAPELIDAVRAYQVHAFSTIFGAVQDAATAALTGDQQEADALVSLYRARRDTVAGALRAQGWDVVPSDGTFFLWISLGDVDDAAVATRLLEDHGVAVAPGSGFGDGGRGHIRIGLVHPEERLAELTERLVSARRALIATDHH